MSNKYIDYKILGAQLVSEKGQPGTRFAVWAPHAADVRLIGDFNHWNGESYSMIKNSTIGVWSLFISGLGAGASYKYEIITSNGNKFHKIDPAAFSTGVSPDFSCRVADLSKYKWCDRQWEKAKKNVINGVNLYLFMNCMPVHGAVI